MTLPSVPGSARGFVVSRQRVLFVQGDDGRLYRSDAPAGSASVALPRNTSSPWAPTLYNAPTDRLVLSVAGQLLQYTGMVSRRARIGAVRATVSHVATQGNVLERLAVGCWHGQRQRSGAHQPRRGGLLCGRRRGAGTDGGRARRGARRGGVVG